MRQQPPYSKLLEHEIYNSEPEENSKTNRGRTAMIQRVDRANNDTIHELVGANKSELTMITCKKKPERGSMNSE